MAPTLSYELVLAIVEPLWDNLRYRRDRIQLFRTLAPVSRQFREIARRGFWSDLYVGDYVTARRVADALADTPHVVGSIKHLSLANHPPAGMRWSWHEEYGPPPSDCDDETRYPGGVGPVPSFDDMMRRRRRTRRRMPRSRGLRWHQSWRTCGRSG